MLINALMQSERSEYLRQQNNPNNKANGYRPRKKAGPKRTLTLAIPRDRLTLFKPLILDILQQEQEHIKQQTSAYMEAALAQARQAASYKKPSGKNTAKQAGPTSPKSVKKRSNFG